MNRPFYRKPKPPKARKPILERFPFTWFPFTLVRSLILFLIDVVQMTRQQIERSIRMQLMLTFAVCLAAAFAAYGLSSALFGQVKKEPVIDYSQGVSRIDRDARQLARMLEPVPDENEDEEIEEFYEEEIPNLPAGSEAVESSDAQEPASGSEAAAPTSPGYGSSNQPPLAQRSTAAAELSEAKQREKSARTEARRQQDEMRRKHFLEEVERLAKYEHLKITITDLEGKALFRSDNATETTVDVHTVIRNAMDSRYNSLSNQRQEFSSFYPVTYNGQKSYLIVSGIPEPYISYRKGSSPVSMLSALALFIFLFYYLTRQKMRYIEELAGGLRIVATGNLDYRVQERSQDELGALARDMNLMAEQLQRKIEEERRAERLKNELVTNVSHDLRTPLTLIMGYLRLLHDKSYETPEQAASYVSIAYSKAEKLKALIDDLFEYTKLSNQDVPLNRRGTAMNDLLEQLLEEHVTIAEEQQLSIVRSIPHDKLFVQIDVDKMIRVFENLLGNAIKYSEKPGTVTVGMAAEKRHVVIRISNKADPLTGEELSRLFDRFYRVDKARSSDTGGSGLGLAIAKSIVEAHGGTIWAESENKEIHFYVKLPRFNT
ncbi:sensor histidine kinase [Paenibacillus ginsengihumi]|mgnify:CR=1 FL=1|uniref:sensor histidine kinase n=1 Tax=Paenibacillus ginsengihumi TaxID=431596 RepID=UPI000370CD30|nr:ATP-binding protein [Paenibacillus ginsengihumi]